MAVTIATSVLGIVSEAFVLAITLLRTAQQVRQASILGFGTTLSKILLRDGEFSSLTAAHSVDEAGPGSLFFL